MNLHPTANMSCLNSIDPAVALSLKENKLIPAVDLNKLVMDKCQVKLPPKLPTSTYVWFMNFAIATLGTFQVLCFVCKSWRFYRWIDK